MENKKKIIVVDNNPVILKLLSSFLEKEGHQVITAQDGIFAIDILRTYVPDIMFVDFIMPNLNGDKLCQIIRSNPKYLDIFIIIFSGIAVEDEVGFDFMGFGANACLAKGPFASLRNDIRSLILQAEEGVGRIDQNKIIGVDRLYKREITRELLDAKKHADMTLDNLPDAVFELTSDGVIVYANPKAVDLTGELEKKLLARNFISLFQKRHIPQVKSSFEVSLSAKRVDKQCVAVVINEHEVSLHFIPIESEAIFSVMVIAHSVSDSRKHLKILENARDFAEVEGGFINQYISGVSCAVDVARRKLVGLSEENYVGREGQLADPLDWQGKVNYTADRLNEISREIAQFSRLELPPYEQKLTVFVLDDLISDSISSLKREAKQKNIPLEIDLPELKDVELIGAPEGLKSVLTGLTSMLLNVCDKGAVQISCQIVDGQNNDTIKCLFLIFNTSMKFSINSKNIFEFILPTYVSYGKYPQDLGKNLIDILRKVKDMGGEVWVEEITDQGLAISFTAYFDICSMDDGIQRVRRTLDRDAPIFAIKKSILFLDNEIITSEFLVNTIEQLTDWQVVVKENFSELASSMEDNKFDLVVVNYDTTSPETIDLAHRIRADLRAENLPIIALTEDTREEQDMIREAGFDDCISKPVDIDDFFAVIERHL